MKNLFATALVLTCVSTAFASIERETGGRMLSFRTEYQCFNRAQLTDAPMVQILVREDGVRAIGISNRGGQKTYGVNVVSKDSTGTTLQAQGMTAVLSADGIHAQVTLKGLELTYKCELLK